MIVDEDGNRLVKKQDLVHIAILLAIALGIGIYLIATTFLIAQDGVFYIEQAQKFSSNPISVIKGHPFGYPFLIFMAHKFVTLFSNNSSVYTWIYSAQSVTLLCRLLALIPLYFIGKLLIDSKKSFWAVLILTMLPYPARFGSDVLREWPHILFLATGFLLLLWGSIYGKWWAFGLVGLSSGLGYLIRHESAQLIVYGSVWVVLSMCKPKLWGVSRWKNLIALALLLIGFAIPAVPYMKCTGRIVPPKVNRIMKSFSFNALPDKTDVPKVNTVSSNYNTAEIIPYNVLKALGKLAQRISENLMHFFVLPMMIGLYCHFRRLQKILLTERFFIFALIVLYLVMMVLLHINYGYISKRHCMPIIVFTVFYIPVGLRIMGNWLNNKLSHPKQKTDILKEKRLSWFVILFLIGTGICMPKLLRPIRIEKQGYRDASQWLKENTSREVVIAAPDRRISFYSGRHWIKYSNQGIPGQGRYMVKILKDKKEMPIKKEMRGIKKVFSVAYDNIRTFVTIYDLRGYISDKVSFVKYYCERIADKKYKFFFVFEANNGFEKDWRIYFHGWVKDENVVLLPKNRQKYKFDNWDFYPKPATSVWPKNEYVTVTREILAKPIPYNFRLGFYMAKERRHGRQINLGWVDLGDIKQSNGR